MKIYLLSFILFFPKSIDATVEPRSGRRLGRLANHSSKGTTYPRVIDVDGSPHLCLFSSGQLQPGEQVLYNYGIKVPFRDLVSNSCFSCVICQSAVPY